MARPYPDKFEREISPLSPQSRDPQTPISYSANVNRQKTKKWVEAKPADYGGDDWGDEYDDYSAPPPPLPKTTGFRQPVQVSNSGGFPNDESNKKVYGDLPSIPTDAQARSVTNPVGDRHNSFMRDDERRAFSGGYAQSPPAPHPAPATIVSQGDLAPGPQTTQSIHPPALQVSTQVPAVTGLRKAVQPSSLAEAQTTPGAVRGTQVDESQSATSSKYSEATSRHSEMRSPSSDFQAHRDFSPSAVPLPLQSRYSPVPENAAADSPSSRFPPRKSSISQPIPPEIFQNSQSAQEVNAPRPWTGARSSSPGATAQSPTTPSKSLPFIRPADIYRRLEEEREKERQSMDSSRPSMESIVGAKATEQSFSPANPPLQQSSSDSLNGSFNKGTIQEGEERVDSGRRLAPTLEPVQERKSEYGFEGYDPTLVIKSSEDKLDFAAPKESQAGRLSPDEIRRFSTSPKLPDLNRISGFGLDLFSQSSTDEPSFQESVLKSIPESSPSTSQKQSNLHTQPSLGFTSMVQQAFNAENSSIPNTPASASSSRVERTGSETTSTAASTAGISPIMSRLSSMAPVNAQDREIDPRENATPFIPEADEPDLSRDSTKTVADVPERLTTPQHNRDVEDSSQHPVQSEHQHNISIPSSGNSPARMPNVANTERFASAEEARISSASDPTISPVEEELLAPRPVAERELSFRPQLPGGWVSYATSASSSTAEQEPRDNQRIETYNPQTEPLDVPVSPISESEEDGDSVGLTPTTAKRSLPHSALGAAAGAAFGGRDGGPLSNHLSSEASWQTPSMIPGNSALPTPDPALAPTGNPYAVATLDPRLQTETAHGKSSLQIQDLSSQRTTSTTSTEPPTPPPKDTPAEEPVGRNLEYFPPTVPLKHKTLDEVAASEGLARPMPPQMLPTLSTQTSPQDEESDKLRKEIIKSLSPKVSGAERSQRLASPDLPDSSHTEDSTTLGARESTYLPSEYDNYWESTNEEEAEQLEREAKAEEAGLKSESEQHQLAQKSLPALQDTREPTPPIPPLSPKRVERTSMEMALQRPPLHANRFSWEAAPEEVSSTTVPINTELQVPSSRIDPRYAATPDSQLRQLEQTREAYFERGPINTSASTPAPDVTLGDRFQDDTNLKSASNSDEQRMSGGQESAHSHAGNDITIAAAGAAGTTAYAGYQISQHDVPQRRLSLAEEKSPANASTYAVSPTPPEDEHPAKVSQPIIPPLGSNSAPVPSGQAEGREAVATFRPQQMPDVTKIMQFKDILAFQNPEQRIRAYNDTRNQFAAMDTGLTEWLMVLNSNQRDSFPAGSWAGPVTASNNADRPKVAKSSPTGVPGTPLQQPYYQQYLNASPTSSVPSMTKAGSGITSGSQQGFSPSGSKLSGQQVQTKSKDLLHSAGVFGGKASKAGKGLFSKGKNKLRGSGGGDKNSPPLEPSPAPKPKVNEGRTSSWTMSLSSLALPRSLARADTPSQHSREATPPLQRQSHLGPETPPVITPQRSSRLVAKNLPPLAVGQTELSLWDAPVSAASTPPIQHATPQPSANNEIYSSRYVGSNNRVSKEGDERDTLGVPAPIGKYQPSWDPYNATPIVEEDGFQYEERPSKPPSAIPPAVHQLGASQVPIDAKSDRSVSGDAAFYDAHEQPAEADDWVIISKENVPRPSELSFQSPTVVQSTSTHQSNIGNQPPAGSQPSGAYQAPADYQLRPEFQPAAEYQPSAAPKPPIGNQPPTGYQPPAISQPQTASQGGFRGRFIQHIRQRSSKDGNTSVPSQTSPPPAATITKQLQPAEISRNAEKRPMDFVGLPPIRRSSTFGLGFRTKDPNKRFPIDDDDEDDVQQEPSMPLPLEGNTKDQRQDVKPIISAASQIDTADRFDNQLSGGTVALGASAIAAAVGDRMNQPSGEPSRYSIQDSKPTQAPAETQQRPTLSNVSSEYSQPLSFSPVSPPMSSPVFSPTLRQTFAAGAPRASLGGPAGLQVESQQIYANQDRRSEAEWRPNARPSQEQRAAQPNSYQRSPPIEAHQSPSQVLPTAVHQRHPSFEGQHPATAPFNQREPSFEGQRVRSPSLSNQGKVGTLPLLSSGSFVPPPRVGLNQQKSFDQPPSSAQRYPALFRAEHGENEASVDGLPAHYYQAPISKEDAFLPRQQTNEYQLPGVGPPPDEPQSGKRSSRRNSALLKELGGRISRSASRDRGSVLDDETRSPIRPVESRDSQSKEDYSVASITSEDTIEKKKRRSGFGFFGALRRDSTGGPPQSRESMTAHLPGSRTESLMQPQQPSSPLAPPDKKKLFFNSNRSSPGPEKSKANKLSRASTSSMMTEQTGKKKRFSGITSIFSRSSMEQERRGSGGSAVQAAQDPRSYLQPAPLAQEPQYLEYPVQQTTQEHRGFQEATRPIGQRAPSPQAVSQNRQDQYVRSAAIPGYAGQSTPKPIQISQSSQGMQRSELPITRSSQRSPPLHLPGLQNPTLQHSRIETRPVQDRHIPQQYVSNLQSPQSYHRQITVVTQSVHNIPSPQNHQRQTSIVMQPGPLSQNVSSSQSAQNRPRQTSIGIQPGPVSQPPTSQSPSQSTENKVNYQHSASAVTREQPSLLPHQVPQQPQYQQRLSVDSQQVNVRRVASPQVASRTSQERQHMLTKQSPVQASQPKIENKQRQGSTAWLLSGLIGGRRSSNQQGKDTEETQIGATPQMATPPRQQQQRMYSNSQLQGTPSQNQLERPIRNEPQYAPLPIPDAYNLVRGEGGRFAPTPYDPRGLNSSHDPYSNEQFMHRNQAHSYPSRPPQIQVQPYSNDQYASVNRPSVPQITTFAPQDPNRDVRLNGGPQQNSQNSNKSMRPLSSEDLVARSPARPQFGQQAPYQLSLPNENPENDERDRPLPMDKSVPSERPLPPGGKPHIDKDLPTERSLPTERALPPVEPINTNQRLSNPALRHPLSPATYPLPEHSPFSPINPAAEQIPPPPPPRWPQQAAPAQSLDRSNTINTHASEISQLSGGQLSVPGPLRLKEQELPASVTPPSPQITPERSPEQAPRRMVSPPSEEDVYSASPRNSVIASGSVPAVAEASRQSPEKILADEGRGPHSGRRPPSREEKILVEEGMVRPGSAQEEAPSMSATSYPGQEWHPYGNGYEEWD